MWEGNGNLLRTLAWKIPWTEEPGGLQSTGSLGVRHDFTFTFHFHALEKAMATHSSVLAWRIPGMGEPGGLSSLGSHRLGHDWSDLAAVTNDDELFFIWWFVHSLVKCLVKIFLLHYFLFLEFNFILINKSCITHIFWNHFVFIGKLQFTNICHHKY